MSSELLVGLVMLGIMGTLFAVGLVLNGPRAKRCDTRLAEASAVECGGCRSQGTLSVRTTSSSEASSSNLVVYCSKCGSYKWQVVGAENRQAA
jgi:Zn finger protein HypA/HybF involved in hydrogenase expression